MAQSIATAISIAILLLLVPLAACSPTTSSAPTTAPATQPSGAAPTGAFSLDVTPVTDGKADQPTKVTATTSPGAKCTIQVTNPKTGTKSSYPKDNIKTADASGKVVWEWTIHRQVAKGDGTILVTAELDGKTVTKEVLFRVIQSDY